MLGVVLLLRLNQVAALRTIKLDTLENIFSTLLGGLAGLEHGHSQLKISTSADPGRKLGFAGLNLDTAGCRKDMESRESWVSTTVGLWLHSWH